jgi:hypothetical protein
LGVVRLAFRAELRRRWRSWLAIALLISVVGGLVLGSAAAGRRTQSAFPAYLAAHGYDESIYTAGMLPKLATLPGVTALTRLAGPDNGTPVCEGCTHPINPTDFGITYVAPGNPSPYKLVSGHLPDPSSPTQVMASFTLQKDNGVHLGTIIRVPFYAKSQAAAYNDATGTLPKPTGPTVDLRVVGFEATEAEFPSGETPTYLLYASKTFADTVLPRVPTGSVYFVRLAGGAADLPRFDAAIHKLQVDGVEGYQSLIGLGQAIETSIHPQALGWWLLALLAALVGLAVVGQGLARQSAVESEDFPTMAALGVDRRQLITLGLLRSAAVGLLGAAGAMAVAFALSPIAPLGEARTAESSTGLRFDEPVLLLGALGVVAVVFALGIWPALRVSRTVHPDSAAVSSHPSALVGHLAASGAPPSAVIGVRNALERRTGGASIPVGSALLGTVLAAVALVGTAVFGSSLAHLTATPALYGDRFALNFTDANGVPNTALLRSLHSDPAVTGITHGFATEITVNKVPVGAVAGTAVRGPLLFSTVSGRLPSGPGQIGLGVSTMHQVGAQVGSVVEVTVTTPAGGRRSAPFRVVSQVSLPVIGGDLGLGSGAVLTISGYGAVACPTASTRVACEAAVETQGAGGGLLVSVVSGPRGQAAIDHYLKTYAAVTALAITPTSLINFGEAVNFPLIFGAMLAVFGAATLAHLLIVSVSRRRQEVGLLRVVGFVNGQVAAVVAWQATTLAIAGIVIGVPLGIAIGQVVWRAFAANLGAVPVSVVPVGLIGILVAGIVVVANLIAVAPALVATRSKAGDLLRTS